MYGHDKKFIAELHKIISTIIEEILKYLHDLSGTEASNQFMPVVITKLNIVWLPSPLLVVLTW